MERKKGIALVWHRFTNLFFIRRRPGLHKPLYWAPPDSDEEYQQRLVYEGFISPDHWDKHNLTDYPLIMQDLRDLEQHLMPSFWDFNQKALHYQNRYYLYQWVFMLGAFFTSILGVLTTYAFTLPDEPLQLLGLQLGSSDQSGWVIVFGYSTAALSAITTYFNVMANNGNPQVRWAKARRLTEELRMLYYQYLSRVEPYDRTDRVEKMRRRVLEIIKKERDNNV